MSRVVTLLALVMVVAVALPAISVDPGIIYNSPTGTTQSFTTVGIPFEVMAPLRLTALGAYDFGANGLTGANINVEILNFTPSQFGGTIGAAVPGTSITLGNFSPQAYGSVWGYLGNPVTLNPGWYILTARGFTSTDPVISGMGPGHTTLDTFNGAVSYGHGTIFGSTTVYWIYTETNNGTAWLASNSAPIHISGGTLGVPEPSAYVFMGTVGIALYFFRRRKAGLKSS